MFNKDELLVLCNIIAAVESEGQVYHTRETSYGYSAFTEAYENTSIEHAITISRYQFMGIEALNLLKKIYAKDRSLFTQELVNDMNTADWNYYNVKRDSTKGQTIIKIISSEIGKECADELIGEQMQEYAKQAESLGVTDTKAQAMSANFIHQGSLAALTRILAKTPKPYTLDNLYNACKTDTGNQVGAYKTRQNAVYNFINQYWPVKEVDPMELQEVYVIDRGTSAQDILNIMRGWIGKNERDGSFKEIIDLYNTITPLPVNYRLSYNDEWCAGTISACFKKLDALDLIGGGECSCPRMIEIFKKMGIWEEDGTITPTPGAIILFAWNQNYQPNNSMAMHVGIVEYVQNGVIHTIEGNANEQVMRRTYPVGHGNIRGYGLVKYNSDAKTTIYNSQPVQENVAPSTSIPSKNVKFEGVVIADWLNCRTWAGTNNPRLKSYPSIPYGTIVEVCDTVKDLNGTPWYYIRINKSVYGFVSSEYIQKK